MDLNKLDYDIEQGLVHRSNGESGPFFYVRSNHTGIAYFCTVYRRYQLPPGKRINTDKRKIHQINYKDGLLYYNYER